MQKGFTIVELVIVIVVIGILASIGIVSYNGAQNRAIDASVQSDLESIAGELEAFRTRGGGTNYNREYPRDTNELITLEIQANKANYDTSIQYNMIYCVPTTGPDAYQAYKLIAQSKTGKIFMMTQDGFSSHNLTTASLTYNLCPNLGMTLINNGMNNYGTWRSWVRSS